MIGFYVAIAAIICGFLACSPWLHDHTPEHVWRALGLIDGHDIEETP